MRASRTTKEKQFYKLRKLIKLRDYYTNIYLHFMNSNTSALLSLLIYFSKDVEREMGDENPGGFEIMWFSGKTSFLF